MKILGINDDVTTCECCGKSNLKKTVVLELDGGGEVHYGTDCASRAIHGNNKAGNKKSIDTLARAASLARKWLAAGHAAEIVATGIGKRFGYQTQAENGRLSIGWDRERHCELTSFAL